jgi:hypothetical protein
LSRRGRRRRFVGGWRQVVGVRVSLGSSFGCLGRGCVCRLAVTGTRGGGEPTARHLEVCLRDELELKNPSPRRSSPLSTYVRQWRWHPGWRVENTRKVVPSRSRGSLSLNTEAACASNKRCQPKRTWISLPAALNLDDSALKLPRFAAAMLVRSRPESFRAASFLCCLSMMVEMRAVSCVACQPPQPPSPSRFSVCLCVLVCSSDVIVCTATQLCVTQRALSVPQQPLGVTQRALMNAPCVPSRPRMPCSASCAP